MLILGGVMLVLVGIASVVGRAPGAGRAFGASRMPGDMRARRGPVTFFVPLGTSLLLSVILTVVLNLAFCAGAR